MTRNVAAIALWFTIPQTVVAQGWSTPFGERKVEIGIVNQSIRRTIRFTDATLRQSDWGRVAAFVRLPLTHDVVIDLSGLAWHPGRTSRFPTRDYFVFTFGAGASYSPIHAGSLDIGLSVHFHDVGYLDQSPIPWSKRTSQLAISAGLTRRFPVLGQQVDLWAAPAYVIDWLTQYPPLEMPFHGTSVHNVGALVGGRVLAAKRLRIFIQVTFAEFWQSETGLSVVF
jgi:hypothetical protein